MRQSKTTAPKLSRRTLLRAAGVAIALPVLEAMTPRRTSAAAPDAPQRLVAINLPLGFYGPNFFPKDHGFDYTLSPNLRPAEQVRKHFTLISGTSHPDVDGGHSAEASFLTAAPHPNSRSFKNTISLDQLLARHIGAKTRFASLTLGDQSLSWSANGVQIPTEKSPGNAFARLFLRGTDQQVAEQQRRLQDGQSVMDTLLEDARALQSKISKNDQEKLEQYFSAVRETENRLAKAESWAKTPKPEPSEPQPANLPSEDFTGRLKLHLDVIRLALQTDSTRVIALCGNGGSQVPPLQGVDKGYHALSHHGKNPLMVSQLEIIDRESIRVWGEFLQQLAEIREGEETLLARTQVLLGSNLGNANAHTNKNLPILLAGGRYRHGSHLAFDANNNEPLCNLFVTMMQQMGLPAESFASSTGPLKGLEVAGAG